MTLAWKKTKAQIFTSIFEVKSQAQYSPAQYFLSKKKANKDLCFGGNVLCLPGKNLCGKDKIPGGKTLSPKIEVKIRVHEKLP